MRRAAFAALAFAALVAAGCTRPAPRPVAVEFWQSEPAKVVEPLVRRFESENPGVVVHVVTLPAASAADSIGAAVAAGHPPDLCELSSADMPAYLSAGTLSDWSAGVADLRDSLRGWPLCMVGDAIYGVPWQLGTSALFVNRALLVRAGSSPRPPETWEQLATAAARVQRLGHRVHGFGIARAGARQPFTSFMAFAWSNGGELLSAGADSSRFDSPGTVGALEFVLRLRKSGMVASQDALEREFVAGRLGMLLADGALLTRLPAKSPAFDCAVAPVPKPAGEEGGHAALAHGRVLASFTASRRKENALRLARFLVRPENALQVVAGAPGAEMSNVGADSLAWYHRHPAHQALALQLATARFTPRHAAWDSMEIAIDEQVALALGGRKPAARAVADADARLAALVTRKGR